MPLTPQSSSLLLGLAVFAAAALATAAYRHRTATPAGPSLKLQNDHLATESVAGGSIQCPVSVTLDRGQAVAVDDGGERVFDGLTPGLHHLAVASNCGLQGQAGATPFECDVQVPADGQVLVRITAGRSLHTLVVICGAP